MIFFVAKQLWDLVDKNPHKQVPMLQPCIKINSKPIKDPNVEPETQKRAQVVPYMT